MEPRIVEARLGRVSLEQIDVSLRVALRASQAATIRSIAFTDAFVGQVPVWVERVQGDWPLEPGRELVIPELVQVRIHARDAVGADDLGSIVRKGAVTVRASVEVAVETPVAGSPHVHGPDADPGPRRRARAADSNRSCRTWDHWRASAPTWPTRPSAGPRPGWPAASVTCPPAARWCSATAAPSPASPRATPSRAAVRATPASAGPPESGGAPRCSAPRARPIEPWRFDVADATALQLGGARLRRDRGAVHVAATADRPALDIDLAVLDQILPAPASASSTRCSTAGPAACGSPTATRSRTWCACRSETPRHRRRPLPCRQPARPAFRRAPPAGDVAAFSPGRSLGVVWTSVTPGKDDRLQIATPLHRLSFGSPLVSADRVVGLVASPTTAWPASLVATAAGRAPRLPSTRPSTTAPSQ